MNGDRNRGDEGFATLAQLGQELVFDPEGFRQRWQLPVLVRRADAGRPSEVDLPGGFHTLAGSRDVVDAALRREGIAQKARVPLEGDVARLEKRSGGAFAERIGIGRAPNVDVQLALSRISKYHAFVVVDDEGRVTLTDARSTFGTFVDSVPLEPMQAVRLEDGADVRLASYEFRFHTPAGLVAALERYNRISVPPA